MGRIIENDTKLSNSTVTWIGNNSSNKVVFFVHGGGYALDLNGAQKLLANIRFWKNQTVWAAWNIGRRSKRISRLFIASDDDTTEIWGLGADWNVSDTSFIRLEMTDAEYERTELETIRLGVFTRF